MNNIETLRAALDAYNAAATKAATNADKAQSKALKILERIEEVKTN